MKLLLPLALALTAAHASAQSPGSEVAAVLVVGPPALLSLAVDASMLLTLVPNGHARRGSAISGLAIGTVTTVLGLALLIAAAGAQNGTVAWTTISATGMTMGVGTIALSTYAVLRPEPEHDSPLEVPPSDAPAAPLIPPPAPPQLRVLPFFGHGVVGGALSLSL